MHLVRCQLLHVTAHWLGSMGSMLTLGGLVARFITLLPGECHFLLLHHYSADKECENGGKR